MRNPSSIGGTYAWVCVNLEGDEISTGHGYVTAPYLGLERVTNNLTELLAIVSALECVTDGWDGTVCTDSLVSLRRIDRPGDTKWNGIPDELIARAIKQRERLPSVTFVLCCGHPTRAELLAGRDERGYPASRHNVRADALCKGMAALVVDRCGIA